MNQAETTGCIDSDGQYLSFTLGNEDYGVDILKVQEIRGWEEVRPLPDTPDYVKGVLDLRGVIVPIIDLRTRFKLDKVVYEQTTVIIVLSVLKNDKPYVIGIVVDGVSDVINVKCTEVRKSPEMGKYINTKYITGMFSQGNRMIVLLDIDKLFNPDDINLPDDQE